MASFSETKELVQRALNCLSTYAQSSHLDSQDLREKLKSEVAYYCSAELKAAAMEDEFQKINNQIRNGTGEMALELLEKFEKNLRKIEKINGEKDIRYKNFIELFNDENVDETVMVVKSTQSLMDPITKMRMNDPVKNTDCGHTYEKSAAFAMINNYSKRRAKCPCPIAGCPAFLDKDNLVVNHEVLRQLGLEESVQEENSQLISLDNSM